MTQAFIMHDRNHKDDSYTHRIEGIEAVRSNLQTMIDYYGDFADIKYTEEEINEKIKALEEGIEENIVFGFLKEGAVYIQFTKTEMSQEEFEEAEERAMNDIYGLEDPFPKEEADFEEDAAYYETIKE